MDRCKQCKGQGYLIIATPIQTPNGEQYSIGVQQCYLCNDQEAWEYVLGYLSEYGIRPPKREVLALKTPGAKIIVMRPALNVEPPDRPPNGPTIA